MVRFTVAIDGELSEKQQHAINASIQQAVLPHLATLDGRGERIAVLPRKEWLGLIAIELAEELLHQQVPEVGRVAERAGIEIV